jgi:hypothetical protein
LASAKNSSSLPVAVSETTWNILLLLLLPLLLCVQMLLSLEVDALTNWDAISLTANA